MKNDTIFFRLAVEKTLDTGSVLCYYKNRLAVEKESADEKRGKKKTGAFEDRV